MSRPLVRFNTVRDLYAAFTTAENDIGAEATDAPSLDFIATLVGESRWREAIGFCAYLLPRREAVWWACRGVGAAPGLTALERQLVSAAEAWVREPEEERRLAALEIGSQSPPKLAATWVALAAGWSGGTMPVSDSQRVPVAPQMTAQAVRGALLAVVPRFPIDQHESLQRGWVAAARQLAVGRPPDAAARRAESA